MYSPCILLLCTVPSVPRLLSVTRILSDGFELNWLPPREPNGRPQYEIEYGTDNTNFTTVDTGSEDTYYNLTGLQQNTTYYIRVVAVNYFTFGGVPLKGNESSTIIAIILPAPGEGIHSLLFRMTWCMPFLRIHTYRVRPPNVNGAQIAIS